MSRVQVKRVAKFFAVCYFVLILIGCAPSYKTLTDSKNYMDSLTIKKADYEFSLGEYIDTKQGCFPPIENPVCDRGASPYKATDQVDAEMFYISITDNTSTVTKEVKDITYLVAAELTKQRGYKTFNVTIEFSSYTCTTFRERKTYGTLSNKNYSGTSYISEDVYCANFYTIQVFLFNNRNILGNGIFLKSSTMTNITPFSGLYIGTTPGVEKIHTNSYSSDLSDSTIYTKDAWKFSYDVEGLISEIKAKYNITKNMQYTFLDMRLEKKERAEAKSQEPIEKYKMSIDGN